MKLKINAELVRLAVIESKETAKTIASRAGLYPKTLSHAMIDGANFRLPTIGKIADALNIPVKDLICT